MKISTKIKLIGIASAVGFASLVAIGWTAGNRTSSTLQTVKDASANLSVVEQMKIAQLNLILAAMDAIVDREEGAIAPERLQIIQSSIDDIREGQPEALEVAQMLDRPELMDGFDASLNVVAEAIQVELPRLIEARAGADAFGAIDDAIDAGGERIGETLETLAVDGQAYIKAALNSTEEMADASTLFQSISAAVFLIGIGAFIWYIGRSVTGSIAEFSSDMNAISAGDLDHEVQSTNRKDEVGAMAEILVGFRQAALDKLGLEKNSADARDREERERNAREDERTRDAAALNQAIDQLAAGLEKLSSGDLTAHIDTSFEGDLERLRRDFNESVQKLAETLGDISHATGSVRGSISEITAASDNLSRRTEQQAASLEETAAALDQISSTVRSSAERADEASSMVSTTKKNAENSGMIMRETITAMEKISETSGQITQIITVIDEIAFQTNLLALNAGVEAARAGEAGKGFAVVAQEVRELAQRSAGAAKEIKELISSSSDQVEAGVSLVNRTGSALSEIETEVSRINDHINSIVTSSREQSTALSEVNSAVNQMDQMTQQNAAMVEQTNAATQGLGEEAGRLEKLVARFRIPGTGAARPAFATASTASRAPAAPAGTTRPTAPRVQTTSSPAARPSAGPRIVEAGKASSAPSPARALNQKLASAFTGGAAAPASNPSTDGWEEF
ncbi:HAMP domain-containing protein [Pseudohoeflea suaedae]|uniref:HAMP domain-containing protein n=1 Tax=Pseudohoeflea suaedae TaxID=877384 RepID=A0A4R5PPC8_9HYPH|nr:methyl-accepting chemotaxis protein [Pseudohoeflea suaedae]TDH38944.1 HAMP domain-containing protein [Pseudohoeflea suaedae]